MVHDLFPTKKNKKKNKYNVRRKRWMGHYLKTIDCDLKIRQTLIWTKVQRDKNERMKKRTKKIFMCKKKNRKQRKNTRQNDLSVGHTISILFFSPYRPNSFKL